MVNERQSRIAAKVRKRENDRVRQRAVRAFRKERNLVEVRFIGTPSQINAIKMIWEREIANAAPVLAGTVDRVAAAPDKAPADQSNQQKALIKGILGSGFKDLFVS